MAQDKHSGKSENLGLSPGPAPILRGTHSLHPSLGLCPRASDEHWAMQSCAALACFIQMCHQQ